MQPTVDVVECASDLDGQQFLDELRRPRSASHVLIRSAGTRLADGCVDAMALAMSAPMAATVSPLPAPAASRSEVALVAVDPMLPPAPTLAVGCPSVCLVSRAAVDSLSGASAAVTSDWRTTFARLNQRLTNAGWRHVAAPGVVLSWQPSSPSVDAHDGAWSSSMVAQASGPANEGLATHVLWASTRLRPIEIVVDGACLTDSIHNGSQAVVINVARSLKRTRPAARVVLAVPSAYVGHVAGELRTADVDVVARDRRVGPFDVAYRPYQLLDPAELPWLVGAGERLMVSQLDMIGFSNPSYHPSAPLFHAVRNLQRYTMRIADAVTFISDFGMETSIAECPDLDRTRCFVVSCGADAEPPVGARLSPSVAARVRGPFIACISATFWHKNRRHAIAVFETLCRVHGYEGSLVIAGPVPYYGNSEAEDLEFQSTLGSSVRDRIVTLDMVGESDKWWLLEHADLVLYPSIIEGFGLVPFEAAAVGTPSLAPAASAIHEVLGEASCLMHSWNVPDWAEAAAAVLASKPKSAALVDEVRRASAGLTWDSTAVRTWEAVDASVARPHRQRHSEEGGVGSRVAGSAATLARGARVAHFTNRGASYLRRRLHH